MHHNPIKDRQRERLQRQRRSLLLRGERRILRARDWFQQRCPDDPPDGPGITSNLSEKRPAQITSKDRIVDEVRVDHGIVLRFLIGFCFVPMVFSGLLSLLVLLVKLRFPASIASQMEGTIEWYLL